MSLLLPLLAGLTPLLLAALARLLVLLGITTFGTAPLPFLAVILDHNTFDAIDGVLREHVLELFHEVFICDKLSNLPLDPSKDNTIILVRWIGIEIDLDSARSLFLLENFEFE